MSDARAAQQQLLWEVGCEELPAWACEQIAAQLPALIRHELVNERLAGDEIAPRILVGPRRFSVSLPINRQQAAFTDVSRGPAYEAAFRDGEPTKACIGFARSRGLAVSELEVREENGRTFVFAVREAETADAAAVWPAIALRVLGKLNFGKAMRWGSGTQRFVRPIRWIVTLLDEDVVAYSLWGVTSGGVSRTHRFLGDSRTVQGFSATAYESVLADGHVVVDQTQRLTAIRDQLDAAAGALNATWRDPGSVLREVVHLVEQPTVLTGRFPERFLQLPARVLVTAMQSHQRYLPLYRADGTLESAFLVVMNGDPAAAAEIIPGYERVLVGRLDDAAFSVQRDTARGIDDMAGALDRVVFHARAGSMAQRAERLTGLAAWLAGALHLDIEAATTAARLAKADQVSSMVQEFAELEGFVGAQYAAGAGYGTDICRAIEQQFLPKSADAPLPDAGLPALVAIADKADLLATTFMIGEQPTGSRDPHGLRRAAIGIVRIVLTYDLSIDIDSLLQVATQQVREHGFGELDISTTQELRSFLDDRVEALLVDDGIDRSCVRAARAAHLPQLQQIAGLARALAQAVGAADPQFFAVLNALRRCTRILGKADADDIGSEIDRALLTEPAERDLSELVATVAGDVRQAVDLRQWEQGVTHAAVFGPAIAAFFDKDTGVKVMADDPRTRANRLAVLAGVVSALAPLGDLTQLQVPG